MNSLYARIAGRLKTIFSTLPRLSFGRRAVPFVIVARSRTGSNFLIDLLNSNRNIFTYSEVFGRATEQDVNRIYARWRAPKPFYIHAVGCKAFYYHPLAGAESSLWRRLESDRRTRIIHLRRRNMLQTLISQRVAAHSNQWVKLPGAAPSSGTPGQLQVSASELEHGFVETRSWERACEERFRNHAVCEVAYEDLVANPEAVVREICDFLGVPFRPLRSRLAKQATGLPSERLENWNELRDHFQGTQWAPFFVE